MINTFEHPNQSILALAQMGHVSAIMVRQTLTLCNTYREGIIKGATEK